MNKQAKINIKESDCNFSTLCCLLVELQLRLNTQSFLFPSLNPIHSFKTMHAL